jgi:hypothetical protein
MADEIKITVLPDGTIKIETDKISDGNHINAAGFIREIFRLAGGKSRRTLKTGASLTHALHVHTADGHHH